MPVVSRLELVLDQDFAASPGFTPKQIGPVPAYADFALYEFNFNPDCRAQKSNMIFSHGVNS